MPINMYEPGSLNQTGEIRTEGLHDYLRVRVQELAKQLKREQEPQYFRGRDAENYVLTHGR